MSLPVRRAVSPLVALVFGLAGVSCGGLPSGRRIDDGPDVRRALSKELGADLELVPPVRLPTGIANQAFSYHGKVGSQIVLAVVFDRDEAVRTLLGATKPDAKIGNTTVIRRHNVVVFYTRIPPAPDRTARIVRALREVLSG